jgi:hypothetical protein
MLLQKPAVPTPGHSTHEEASSSQLECRGSSLRRGATTDTNNKGSGGTHLCSSCLTHSRVAGSNSAGVACDTVAVYSGSQAPPSGDEEFKRHLGV